MEWPERLDAAVDYIENNLTEKIDFREAADRAFCSVYHFHRMFLAISGITPGEYARQRRLTLAGRDLLAGGKILDIAVKYGYDSPSAFSRAFRVYHGAVPGKIRKSDRTLKSYPRIMFHNEIRRGNEMEYRIIEKPSFCILGRSTRFGVADGEFRKNRSSFWTKYVATQEYRRLCEMNGGRGGPVTGAPVMTAYLPNENGTWDPVINVLGTELTETMNTGEFEVFTVPAAVYAEFECTLKTSAKTNKQIYGEWFPSTGYEHGDSSDIALFFQAPWNRQVYVRWWIPIIRKTG